MPPKPIEFRLIAHQRFEERTGETATVFEVETVKQFRTYRYELNLTGAIDRRARTIRIDVGGMKAPSHLMPELGTARGRVEYPKLARGVYTVRVTKAPRLANEFRLRVGASGLAFDEPVEGAALFITAEVGPAEFVRA